MDTSLSFAILCLLVTIPGVAKWRERTSNNKSPIILLLFFGYLQKRNKGTNIWNHQ